MELSSPKIKRVLIFLKMELSYILGRNFPSPKNKKTHSEFFFFFFFFSLHFGKWNFLAPNLKSYYIFSKRGFSYISGGTFKAPKTKISYISQKKVMNKFF